MNLTGQPIHSKDPTARTKRNSGSDPDRLAKMGAMPCMICEFYGMEQLSRTRVHHAIHGRYGNRKAPDSKTMPVCGGHHNRDDGDMSKIALHCEPDKWKQEYGLDTDWLSYVEDRL